MKHMKRSHWHSGDVEAEGGTKRVHFLMSVANHVPALHGDVKLAERIGELDPFILAAERGEDILLENVLWVINSQEEERKLFG